jgi:hypothetical protein
MATLKLGMQQGLQAQILHKHNYDLLKFIEKQNAQVMCKNPVPQQLLHTQLLIHSRLPRKQI